MSIRRLVALLALVLFVPGEAHARDILPDLDQAQPTGLEVRADRSGAVPRFHLGFNSAVDNTGAGPLTIDAHRASRDDPQMVADQTIRGTSGGTRTIAGVGHLEYVYSEDHNHWHYLGFDRYELRRARDYAFVAPDQKTGFCLGDRYTTHPGVTQPGKPPVAFYTDYCGRTQTGLLMLREGISVGYGDIYYANLEGQFVDVTGVAAGQYYLVHRVNADGRLRESDYSNNAASVRIGLSWPDGMSSAPSVRVLRVCAGTDYCPGPAQAAPALGRVAARGYARAALARVLGFEPSGFRVSCRQAVTRTKRSCTASGPHGTSVYLARVNVAFSRSKSGVLYYRYAATVTVTNAQCRPTSRRSCARKLARRAGRVRIGPVSGADASAAVAEPSQRLVALDDPLLDRIGVGPVVHEVPRLVRHPLGGLGSGAPAQ